MSYVRLIDTAAGIRGDHLRYARTPTGDCSRPMPAGSIVATKFTRSGSCSSWFPAPNNDIVRIVIDGDDIGNELGVCLHDVGELLSSQSASRAGHQQPHVPRNAGAIRLEIPHLVGRGFLFDNVTTNTTPASGPVPAGCGEEPPPIVIDKTTRTRFARPDDLITYRISVRNRGDAPVRGLRACDRAPRALRFVGARRVCIAPRAVDGASRSVCCGPVSARRSVPPSGYARTSRRIPSPTAGAWTSPPGPHRSAPHRIRTAPARQRRPPRAAATPGRQGRHDDPGGADCPRCSAVRRLTRGPRPRSGDLGWITHQC